MFKNSFASSFTFKIISKVGNPGNLKALLLKTNTLCEKCSKLEGRLGQNESEYFTPR